METHSNIPAWRIPMDRGACWATDHGVLEPDTSEQLSIPQHIHFTIYKKKRSYLIASLVVQMVKHLPAMWETRIQLLGQEDPLEKEMATHSSTLA